MAKAKGPRMRKLGAPSRVKSVAKPVKFVKLQKKLPRLGVLPLVGKVLSPVLKPLGKIVPPYFKNAWAELREVTWPNRRETWRLTGSVFAFAIVFGLFIAGVDKLLDTIFKATVLK